MKRASRTPPRAALRTLGHRVRIIAACLIVATLCLFGNTARAQPVSAAPPHGAATSVTPNVTLTCGQDGTTALQNALDTTPVVTPTSCPQSNPVFVSQTITIPSFTSLVCTGGSSWIKLANQGPAGPIVTNANSGNAGRGNNVLDQSITVQNCNFDGNSANQAVGSQRTGLYFLGVSGITLENMTIVNTISNALQVDGNGAHTDAGFIDHIKINGVKMTASGSGFGLSINHAQRNMFVSDISVQNAGNDGIFLDASEGNYVNLSVQGAGAGSTCANNGEDTVNNPADGGNGQSNWVPCAPGIYVRNVTNITGANWATTDNNYYGIVIVGARHMSVTGITSASNSLAQTGTWNDVHLDANPLLGGYGENAYVSLAGVNVGANTQNLDGESLTVSPPSENLGLFIAQALPGSCADATIIAGGTGYSLGDTVSLATAGATLTENCAFKVTAQTAGAVTAISRIGTQGFGQFTKLPPNPVATTGGTGTGLTLAIQWSAANITGVTCGQTIAGCIGQPAFREYWTVDAVGIGAPPLVNRCEATISDANTIVPAGCGTLTAGLYTPPDWITPSTVATVEVLGGGGGGGYCNTSGQSGGGGGAGGLAIKTGAGLIQPGGTYTLAIGAGGIGGVASAHHAASGGPSSIALIGVTPSATGGAGGATCSAGPQTNAGGAGSNGDTNLTGGTGTNSADTVSIGGTVPLGLGQPGQRYGNSFGYPGLNGLGFGAPGSGALAGGGNGGHGQPGMIAIKLSGQ